MVDKKVSYYIAPKCASSTLRQWYNILNNPILSTDTFDLMSKSKLDSMLAYKIVFNDFLKKNPTYNIKYRTGIAVNPIRFCVVRDPEQRFISAFGHVVSKLKLVNDVKCVQDFISKIDDSSIDSTGWTNVRNHMKSQVECYGGDARVYTHIFNMNQLNDVKMMLETESGIKLPDLRIMITENENKPRLNESELAWVKNKYSKDYVVYGKWM